MAAATLRTSAEIGYPRLWVDALRERDISLHLLPVLDLGGRREAVIEVDEKEMTSPLMQFTDIYGRLGLAFRLRGKLDMKVEVSDFASGDKEIVVKPIQELRTIMSVFQRQVNADIWETEDGSLGTLSFDMNEIYWEVHKPDHERYWATHKHDPTIQVRELRCPTCPKYLGDSRANIKWAYTILSNTDPVWKID